MNRLSTPQSYTYSVARCESDQKSLDDVKFFLCRTVMNDEARVMKVSVFSANIK